MNTHLHHMLHGTCFVTSDPIFDGPRRIFSETNVPCLACCGNGFTITGLCMVCRGNGSL